MTTQLRQAIKDALLIMLGTDNQRVRLDWVRHLQHIYQ